MKINRKKVAKWTIEAAIFFGGIALGTYAGIRVTSGIDSLAVYLPVILAIAAIVGVSSMILITIVDTSLSDEIKQEFVNQLEARKNRDASQYVAVASNHGDNLEDVMEAIRHEEWEYYALFDLSGRKLAEGTFQSPEICNITTEDWQGIIQRKTEIIGLHNHPGAKSGSFSDGDFAAFLQFDFIRQYIVVTRKYNYILEKTGNGYEKFHDEVRTYAGEMFTKYLWLGNLSRRLWSVLVSRKTAKKFGLEFHIERAPQTAVRKNRFRIGLATCAIAALCLTLTGSDITAESYSLPSSFGAAVAKTAYFDYSTYDENQLCEGSVDLDGCDPANDPAIQGNAPVGGGANYDD